MLALTATEDGVISSLNSLLSRNRGFTYTFTMSIVSFFQSARDSALEMTIKLWFNRTQQSYGRMTSIKVDSTNRTIQVELDLEGEASPLLIDVKSYAITADAGETVIELGEIQTSREWVNVLLGEYLKPANRRFPVPSFLKALL